jgi:hypothetical protein
LLIEHNNYSRVSKENTEAKLAYRGERRLVFVGSATVPAAPTQIPFREKHGYKAEHRDGDAKNNRKENLMFIFRRVH